MQIRKIRSKWNAKSLSHHTKLSDISALIAQKSTDLLLGTVDLGVLDRFPDIVLIVEYRCLAKQLDASRIYLTQVAATDQYPPIVH